MTKELKLKNNENLDIELADGTMITIIQAKETNSVMVSHHKTKLTNDIELDNFGYGKSSNNKNAVAWTDCKSSILDENTKNRTFVSHTAFDK